MSYFLKKPYTDTEYADFIVLHNHNNRRRIEETETALYALEPWEIFINGEVIDNTEAYEAEQFALAKEAKYKEANEGAKEYLESGSALYALELPSLLDENHTPETYHIEATDGNIGKLAAYALAFISGQLGAEDVVYWNTKEDATVALNSSRLTQALTGLGTVQAQVWNVKFPAYLALIESCTTAAQVNSIVIDYSQDTIPDSVPVPEETVIDEVPEETEENTDTTGDDLPPDENEVMDEDTTDNQEDNTEASEL